MTDHGASGRRGGDAPAERPAPRRRSPRAAVITGVLTALVVLGLLAAGIFAAYWFNATEGRAEQAEAPAEEASRVVETVTAQRGDHAVVVRAMGTVRPALEAIIRPRVSGMIVEQDPSFVPGGFFPEGAEMLQIDRADYEQALEQRQSELAQARALLEIELGDQAVAREELKLLEVDIPEINRDLILRIPQVNQAKAQVRSAEAAVQRAELDLERTVIVAPFDGHVVSRSVSAGNNVSAGDQLATFVGTHEYWIEVAVPVSSLRWIEVPSSPSGEGSTALVRYPRVWGPGAAREGRVSGLVGQLEAGSRLARVIVSVLDPLARDEEHEDDRRLLLDAFVDVEIRGRVLRDSFVVDRDLIREGNTVWVMGDDDRLVTRRVTIAFGGRDDAWVRSGLQDGDRVIRTNLQMPVEGMLLRLPEPPRSPTEPPGGAGESDG